MKHTDFEGLTTYMWQAQHSFSSPRLSLTGLIDYNFHCFRKAIHEVFEVGVASHRICNHQASTSNMKAVTHNGTPRNAV